MEASPQEELSRFFQLYDCFRRDAADLASSQRSLETARSAHQHEAEALRIAKFEVERNTAFIEEQMYRIELVSTHWFYGTTALQPQLWLRGGCHGKIDRADAKLEKAQEDHSRLEIAQQTQQEKETVASGVLRSKEAAFGRASDADEEAKRMKAEVINKYASHLLNQLVERESSLRVKIDERKVRLSLLTRIGAQLNDAMRCVSVIESHTKAAEKKMAEAEKIATENVQQSVPTCASTQVINFDNGGKEVVKEISIYRDYKKYDAKGNVVLTNNPCPSGCGFVITFHATHCCAACSNPQNRAGYHGRRCERIMLASQQGSVELWNSLQKQRQEHCKKVEQMQHQAKRELEDAVRELHKGCNLVQRAAATLNAASLICLFAGMPPPRSCGSGGCSCCSISSRANNIRARALQLQLTVNEALAHLTKRRQYEGQEGLHLSQQLDDVLSQIANEEDSIFSSLRASSVTDDNENDAWDRPPAIAPSYSPATATTVSENGTWPPTTASHSL
jgi:hypothetical protein